MEIYDLRVKFFNKVKNDKELLSMLKKIGETHFLVFAPKKYFEYKDFDSDKNKSFKNRFLYFIVNMLRFITDIVYGIESGFRICCIIAYITHRRYQLSGIHHHLCYRCYLQRLNE